MNYQKLLSLDFRRSTFEDLFVEQSPKIKSIEVSVADTTTCNSVLKIELMNAGRAMCCSSSFLPVFSDKNVLNNYSSFVRSLLS